MAETSIFGTVYKRRWSCSQKVENIGGEREKHQGSDREHQRAREEKRHAGYEPVSSTATVLSPS